MDVNGLPIIGPGVDYYKVGAIHQKRTLAFINHFISNTVAFLNKFSRSCEQRLQKFEDRIQKIDASLSILEAKLSSIPTLDKIAPSVETNSVPTTNVQTVDVPPPEQLPEETSSGVHQQETSIQTKSQDPRYAKFFRMVQVGVPIAAVRLKMKAEGLDPSILDDPDGVAAAPASCGSSSDTDNESSFSE